ncbi:M20/M25/M40 family metallo-hydrolase [Aquitalea magnusonii]|nr:M20/M25/M40 family metallo-hydrolase [Aquitalea magnusonii]
MALRHDALFAASAMIGRLEQLAAAFSPYGLVTVGQLLIPGSSRNTIPGLVRFTIDLRHHQDAQIAAMEAQTRSLLQQLAAERGLTVDIQRHWFSAATPFDRDCIGAVRQAVTALGYPHQDIVSGAGHDAIHLARHCPTTMIFIPCVEGISHNEAENALPQDVSMGADVLLGAVLLRAGGQPPG